MARSIGDPLSEGADIVTFRYCRRCDRQASSCPHEGNRFEVGLYGGHVNARVLQLAADGKWVRWTDDGAYLLVPRSVLLHAYGGRTSKVEVLDGERWWVLDLPWGTSQTESWDDGRVRWDAIPRHARAPYAPREVRGQRQVRKVRETLATKPCYCHQGSCPDDYARRVRWAHEHAGMRADFYLERARPLW